MKLYNKLSQLSQQMKLSNKFFQQFTEIGDDYNRTTLYISGNTYLYKNLIKQTFFSTRYDKEYKRWEAKTDLKTIKKFEAMFPTKITKIHDKIYKIEI
jgi:hypothetical protein